MMHFLRQTLIQQQLKITRPMAMGGQTILTHSSALVRYVVLLVTQFPLNSNYVSTYEKRSLRGRGRKLKEVAALCGRCLGGVRNTRFKLPQPTALSCGFFQQSYAKLHSKHAPVCALVPLSWSCPSRRLSLPFGWGQFRRRLPLGPFYTPTPRPVSEAQELFYHNVFNEHVSKKEICQKQTREIRALYYSNF